MNTITATDLSSVTMDMGLPTTLYAANDHSIFWLGNTDEMAFRCNTYLIVDQHEAILIDPGSKQYFSQVRQRVEQIMSPEEVSGMVLCHQDPDVAASMTDWLDVNPSMKVFTTPRTQVLLPHYGCSGYTYYDVTEKPVYGLPSGASLKFIEAPFLHFPGAFVTYDTQARYLFSGDIWAALDLDWTLTVNSFAEHIEKMNLFHLDYMASNLATRGFVRRLENFAIDDILAFSRMGRLEISMVEVSMEGLAYEVSEELKLGVAGRELAMKITPLPPCRGDLAMLRQVWVNLLGNAIKFIRTKAAVIEVGGHAEGAENIYYVKDNGADFDMQYADKLFDVFQRLHGNEEFEGTGIGLAIVKRVIVRHGGRVWAEGKVDEGATFYFALPIYKLFPENESLNEWLCNIG